MKLYAVSSGSPEFHRVEAIKSDWNVAIKEAIEEHGADDDIRTNKVERDGQTVWEYWNRQGEYLVRITQLDLS